MYNNQLDLAILNYKKATNLNLYQKKRAQSLCQLARCYREKGEYYKSIEFHIKGIELLKTLDVPNTTITHCINMANTSNQLKETEIIDLVLPYLHLAAKLLKNNKKQKHYYRKNINLNNALASLYLTKKNIKKAQHYYFKTLNIVLSKKDSSNIAMLYTNIGELYHIQKSDSALYFLNKALHYNTNLKEKTSRSLKAENYRIISNYFLSKKQLKKAYYNIQKSINITFSKSSDITPSKKQFLNTSSKRNLIRFLKTKIDILFKLYSEEPGNKSYLQEIIKTVDISNTLVELIIEDSNEQATKFLWRNDISEIYSLGAYASFLIKDTEQFFNYLEKNKAFLLTQSIQDNSKKATLPNHIINTDKKFRKKIYELEEQVNDIKFSKNKKDSLFTIKLSYQKFQDSIQKIYPHHFENKNKTQLLSLAQVKKSLNKNSLAISYTSTFIDTTKTEIIGLAITKNKTISFKVPDPKKTISQLNEYRKLVSKPLNTKLELENFKKTAFHIYNNLFPSEEIKNLIKNKQLIITADNILQNIPFEAFITSNESVKYLVEETDISYAYSMSFLEFNSKINRNSKENLIGFAPVSFNNSKLPDLTETQNEVSSITALLNNSTLFTGKNASKHNFLNQSNTSKIIHLATHASSSNNPVIYFSNDSLKLHELYTYKNNADLVVLSACETNLGKLKKGEGILSLARGFFYSGSNSVISSLWNVNDNATSFLMKNFYQNLTNNQTKAKALNNAKRKYLKEHSLSEKAPYYWASFVLIGDTNIVFDKNYTLCFFFAFVSLLVFLFFFIKKRG